MKKKSIVCLAVLALLSSCDVETTTVMFAEDHTLSNAGDTVFSVLGIMSLVQEVIEESVLWGEVRGDLVTPSLQASEMLHKLSRFETDSDTAFVSYYRKCYAIVNNCNYFLSRADSAMERRGQRIFLKEYAAVSAYRAWAYMQLAQNFGEVPFYTHPLLSFSQIQAVANDRSNRKGMSEICSFFIQDLSAYTDVAFPDYNRFTYAENKTIDSRYFFFPVRLLLGDMYLWRGACTDCSTDYAMAAQQYRDYLYQNELYVSSGVRAFYANADFVTWSNTWRTLFSSVTSAERVSIIPLASTNAYGKTATLSGSFALFLGSESLKKLVDTSYYCYVSNEVTFAQMADSIYWGTSRQPVYFSYVTTPGEPLYALGDLRLYRHSATLTYDMPIEKYLLANPHVTTYRVATVYLRLAEAINRSGYPLTAFTILKYGLSNGNLLRYDTNGEFASLLASGYTFYDMGDNERNIGIHARGCGNAEMDTLHYSFPQLSFRATMTDSIEAVEELICREQALETAFEGNRWPDLMRMAMRRGEIFLATKIAQRDHPNLSGEELENLELYRKLLNVSNWYLPIPK